MESYEMLHQNKRKQKKREKKQNKCDEQGIITNMIDIN